MIVDRLREGRRRQRVGLPLLAALAFVGCQETFKFVSVDAGTPPHIDAGVDAGSDAGVDAGTDAGVDAGDAGTDAGVADGWPCTTDDECHSGQCLGRCCSAACSMQDADCSATACDDAGACLYADAGLPCGTIAPVCTNSQLTFHACDGKGTCQASVELCPGGFVCEADGSDCAAQCGPGACPDNTFCDPEQVECCPIISGNALHIDGTNGSDTGCCGMPAQPCRTLTRTMQLVTALGTSNGITNLDLLVAGGGDGGGIDWVGESWPIRLHFGVSIMAPNVHFVPPPGNPSPAFVVNSDSPQDTTTVQIVGQQNAPVVIGMDTQGLNLNSTTIAIDDGASVDGGYNLPLVLENVWLNGSEVGLRVGAGANVTLGAVAIGSGVNNYYFARSMPVTGTTGLLCEGTAGSPAIVATQVPAPYWAMLTIDSQSSRDIDVEDGCDLTLSSVTLGIGSTYYPGGVGACLAKPDTTGLYATGASQLSFGSLASQCMDGFGVYLVGSDAGAPVMNATTATLQNCGCAGAYVAGGAELISDVMIRACQIGMQIDDDGRMVPGKFIPTSAYGYPYGSINCNSSAEPSDLCRTAAGIDLLNTTSATTADARGLQWDLWNGDAGNAWSDAGSTQVWSCSDRTFKSCTCQGAFCTSATAQSLPDDADAVFLQSNTAARPFNLNGGSVSYYSCN